MAEPTEEKKDKLKKKRYKTEPISASVTKQVKEDLVEASEIEEVSLSTFIVNAVKAKTKEVLEKRAKDG